MPKTVSQLLRKLSRERFRITFPTALTILRLVLTPFIVVAMAFQLWGAAFGLFLVASITDLLDGFLARRWNQRTFFGACLDPIADKVLILSVFFTLAFVHTPLFSIPRWFCWFVLAKELLQVFGAIAIYKFKGNLEIRPTILGKLTTVVQMCFILWLFTCYFFHWMPVKTYSLMLSILFMLVLATFIHYGTIGFKFLKGAT
ncbi:MAG: CDP-alcohol phosphatidyltransferase family protein [Candidatus Babeliales bacterium]